MAVDQVEFRELFASQYTRLCWLGLLLTGDRAEAGPASPGPPPDGGEAPVEAVVEDWTAIPGEEAPIR